jgi:hypothetical protein
METKTVATCPRTIDFEDFARDPGRVFDEIDEGDSPVLVERHGRCYRVERSRGVGEDLWSDYDPAAVRAAVKQAAGSWSDVDAVGAIERIYEARAAGSRPPARP